MRLLAILLAALLVLTACNGDDAAEEPEENGQEPEEEVEPEEEDEGDQEAEEASAEASTEDLVLEAVQSYSDAIEEVYVAGEEVEDFATADEVADYLLENAQVTEDLAQQMAESVTEDEDGTLVWAEVDHAVTFEDENTTRFEVYPLFEDNYLINITISGDAEEYRGHYNYNVVEEDGEWLFDEFHFGYIDGEHPDDQVEEEESDEGEEDEE
ncbi:hypothetical protein [Alkalibacillus aidingensis]|uniref:hypothetical protein n=1 Tax=Alkalibacillus aidingensis TaxID=2747607 RepID=UPI0016613CAF|nr:hypothetical protein [Alkalibacillus aidingensis]